MMALQEKKAAAQRREFALDSLKDAFLNPEPLLGSYFDVVLYLFGSFCMMIAAVSQ